MPPHRYRLGCDIGGTFTDFVLLEEETGRVVTEKRLSTPDDPADAVEAGIRALQQVVPGFTTTLGEVIHGTTLVINAIIERKGAVTGLITTAGFRDVLELGREQRYAPYDVFAEFPEPLVPRRRRLEIAERVRADGRVLRAPDEDEIRSVIRRLVDAGAQSVAVCLLNSFENPEHEQMVARLLEAEAPGLAVSVSSEVLPQIREYERTSTTVTNAYVQPLTQRYLAGLTERLAALGCAGRLFIMLSSGGVTTARTASRFPVRIIESGPTAGVIAGEHFSRAFGVPDLFCFDMGGTTAKSCLIRDGAAGLVERFEVGRVQRFCKGSGLIIQVPVVDLLEIGAGGGSVARISKLGTLRVGPDSAGAAPGPACYGRGGEDPCVTDADLLLGYLDADYFLGGALRLDPAAARSAVREKLAEPLGLSVEDAAWGIHELIDETMAAAARAHIAEKGGDPRAVTVLALGGAGPVHAAGLAARLGARRVLVPPNAGVGSALGFFTAPRSFDVVQSHKVRVNDADLSALEALFQSLQRRAAAALGEAGAEADLVRFDRSVDARFVGQGAETSLALPPGDLTPGMLRSLFDQRYAALYGRTYPDSPVELVSFRVRASLPVRPLELPPIDPAGRSLAAASKGPRPARCARGGVVPHAVYARALLPPEARLRGPAIIEERESTVVVPSGAEVRVDARGFLWIDLSPDEAGA